MIASIECRVRGTYREILSWPYFGHVERIIAEFLRISFLRLHDLHFRSPGDRFTPLDGLPEVSLGVIGVLARHADRLAPRELLLAAVGEEVILDVDELPVIVDPIGGYSAYTNQHLGGDTHTT